MFINPKGQLYIFKSEFTKVNYLDSQKSNNEIIIKSDVLFVYFSYYLITQKAEKALKKLLEFGIRIYSKENERTNTPLMISHDNSKYYYESNEYIETATKLLESAKSRQEVISLLNDIDVLIQNKLGRKDKPDDDINNKKSIVT